MITLLGVGHVFDISDKVKGIIRERGPGVVCVELDRARYDAMLRKDRGSGGSATYRMLADFQRRTAEKYGVEAGQEMLAAVQAAKEARADVAFIDMNAAQVWTKFWKSMSLRERMKLFFGAIGSVFVRKKTVEKELERYNERPQDYIELFAEEFPNAKKVLIDDRDRHMAGAIRELSQRYDGLVAVVGDGHILGISQLIDDLGPEVIRLSQLQTDDIPTPPSAYGEASGDSATVSFGFEVEGQD